MPSSANAANVLTATSKQPRPSTKATDNFAQPSKQDTGATTPEVTHHLPVTEVSMKMLPDSPASTANQMTTVQPLTQTADLVDQSPQNPIVEEPVVQLN
ncbi:hypothetical protein ACFX1S_014940 [Malus domestica]